MIWLVSHAAIFGLGIILGAAATHRISKSKAQLRRDTAFEIAPVVDLTAEELLRAVEGA